MDDPDEIKDVLWAPCSEKAPFFKPERKTDNAAGWDLYLPSMELLRPGEVARISLNLTCYMPANYMAIFEGRSGIASEFALVTLGGVIDSDYAGNWIFNCVMVPDPEAAIDEDKDRYYYDPTCQCGFYRFDKGERIGQVVFHEKPKLTDGQTTADHVQMLHKRRAEKAEKKRTGGHGSTGRF